MATIAFIPVRGGSKSIPLKNIKLFCGRPLVYWVIKALEESKGIDRIIVATDSDVIANTVKGFKLLKTEIYQRLPENAGDTASTESVMLEFIEKNDLSDEDIFMLVQATSPLLVSDDVNSGLKLFEKHDAVLSCVQSKRFIWSTEGEALNYDYKNRPRRQEFAGFLMENGAFYISSVGAIRQSGNRLSGNIGISVMPEYTDVEIDEEADWIVAESLMHKYILSNRNAKDKTIKLFVTDVDGVLTDAGMYYSEKGDELKKFNTHDGKAFQLLRENGIKTGIVTSEDTLIVTNRAKKLQVDYLYQGKEHGGKLNAVQEMCAKEGISLEQVAYIGDDINCFELLSNVGLAACPLNALEKIKNIPNIIQLHKAGGEGVVREFVEFLLVEKGLK